MLKTEKLLRIKNQSGRTLRVVREHYVREDVPCYSSLCLAGCNNTVQDNIAILPKDVTHYIVPDCQVARDFLEVLELPQFEGIIFMQTVVHSVQHEGSKRLHNRLKNLVKDIRRQSIIFHNEFQKYAYHPREPGEALVLWQERSVFEATAWYFNHLAGQMPLVLIVNSTETVERYKDKAQGVFVMTLGEYLDRFWPNLEEAHLLFESLSASLKESSGKAKVSSEYTAYLPNEILEQGIKSGQYIQGNLQVNKHNAMQEAFVRRTVSGVKDDKSLSDILIHGMAARNRAVHGDSVVVELLPKSGWRGRSLAISGGEAGGEADEKDDDSDSSVMPTGRIVGVLQRNWRDYVVSFSQDQESKQLQNKAGNVLVIPWDYRIPKIRISTRQADALRDNRIIVRIDSWEVGSQYPNGHFVRALGKAGELETEVAAILIENSISVGQFSEGQMKELPTNAPDDPWKMSEEEVSRRRDLRESHFIFSIDPKGCEDVDDTLSIRKLENGNRELGVHIADVSYFVKPSSLTDLEARLRSTTVYLADRRFDMLPAILSADLCSLIGSVDRYAMSVIWELDQDCEVVDVWYGRTIIRSRYKLFYEIAQAMHDGADIKMLQENIPELQHLDLVWDAGELQMRLDELQNAVNLLMDTARQIHAKRTKGGALELEGVEVQVQMDSTKKIEDLIPKQPMEIHETVAECMIFANHWVAKKIAEVFPNQALLRHHPLPRQEHFETLVACAKAKGFTVTTKSNKMLADSLDRCVDPKDPNVNKLLRSLATQAMSNAQYFSTGSLPRDQFFHYGLALDRYTHFTSPIRRYADVIVHRLLLAALDAEDNSQLLGNKELEQLAQHINNKHRAAQNAQKDSQKLFQALFFKDRPPDDEARVADAVIFQLRANGVLVFIPRYGIKGPVYLKSRDGQVIHASEGLEPQWVGGTLSRSDYSITVNSMLGSHVYKLFDHITVKISVQQTFAHAADLKLDLLSNRRLISTNETGEELQGVKTNIIREVQEASEEQAKEEELDLGPNFHELQSQYGQTNEALSLYSIFQSFYELGLKQI